MTGERGERADERALVARWRDLASLYARTAGEIDRELHPFGIGASDFEVLDVLAAGDGADGKDGADGGDSGDGAVFRVQDLADRVHLSQSALSRLVARLEKDGLVDRSTCSEDRRGVRVTLTGAGRRRYEQTRPRQRAVLERMLAGR